MLNKIKYTLLVIFAALLFEGCKNEMIGPDIEALGYPPSIKLALTRSKDTIKTPLSQSVYFSAQFEKDVTWQLQLTGEESGAKYTINGVGAQIDQSNSTWSGQIDNASKPFTNENVKVVLSFPNSPSTPTSSVKVFIFSNGAFDNRGSVLVADFTKTKFYGFGQTHPNDGYKYWASEYPLPITTHTAFNPSPDGNAYAFFSGKPTAASPKVFYSEVLAKDRDGGLATDVTFPLFVDPDMVYFNIDVYSTAIPPSVPNYAWLLLLFTESDGSIRQLEIKQPSWSGWKTISVKYSDLQLNSGFGKGNPDELVKIGIVFLSANSDITQTVSLAIDHPIFTFGKPSQP